MSLLQYLSPSDKHKSALTNQASPQLTRGGGGGYSHTLPIRVYATQWGRNFEAPDLERGIHFRGIF